jgi:hypothetical protein
MADKGESMKSGGPSDQPTAKVRKMISEFSNLATLKWVAVAFGIHVVAIGLFSIGEIYTAIGGGDRTAATDADESKAPTTAPTTGPATRPTTRPSTPPGGAAPRKPVKPAAGKEGDGEESMTPAMRELLAPAKPSEIPKAPTHMDIDEPEKPKTVQDANREVRGKTSP